SAAATRPGVTGPSPRRGSSTGWASPPPCPQIPLPEDSLRVPSGGNSPPPSLVWTGEGSERPGAGILSPPGALESMWVLPASRPRSTGGRHGSTNHLTDPRDRGSRQRRSVPRRDRTHAPARRGCRGRALQDDRGGTVRRGAVGRGPRGPQEGGRR